MQHKQETDPQAVRAATYRHTAQPGTTLALLTIIGIVLYILIDIIAQLLPPHYNPISQAESDLAVGPYGFIMAINFVIRGLLSLALVAALIRAVTAKKLLRPGLVLLAIWGAGALVLAVFPTDITGATLTLHGVIHLFVAALAFICGAVGELLLSLSFARDEQWGSLRNPTMLIAILAIIALVLLFISFGPALRHASGLVERIFIGLVLLWMLVVASRLHAPPVESKSVDNSRGV